MSEPRKSVLTAIRRGSVNFGLAIGALGPEDIERLAQSSPDVVPDLENPVISKDPKENEGLNEGYNVTYNKLDNDDSMMEIIHYPVTILYHTFRTNFDALVAAGQALVLIIVSKLITTALMSKGGMWGNLHGALCANCMVTIELAMWLINGNKEGFISRRVCIAVPVNILGSLLLSCFLFNWQPGLWSPVILTASLFVASTSCYPMCPEPRGPFLNYAKKQFMASLSIHGLVVLYIYCLIIPTRMLAESDGEHSEEWTIFVTGFVFPGLAFMFRKFMISVVQKITNSTEDLDHLERLQMLSRFTRMVSSAIFFVPSVLLYFNTNLKFALLSALSQLITEVVGKSWVIWATKQGFHAYLNAVHGTSGAMSSKKIVVSNALLKLSQEPGVNNDIREVNPAVYRAENEVLRTENAALKTRNEEMANNIKELKRELKKYKNNGDDSGDDDGEFEEVADAFDSGEEEKVAEWEEKNEEGEDEAEVASGDGGDGIYSSGLSAAEEQERLELIRRGKQYNYALSMIALRWNSEIIAEKGSLVCGALVAFLYFGEMVETSEETLANIGLLYFLIEGLSDVAFVKTVTTFFDVPMLTAVPQSDILSTDSLASSLMLALCFNAMGVCIAMAATVPLLTREGPGN
jgi:hypothetical protein